MGKLSWVDRRIVLASVLFLAILVSCLAGTRKLIDQGVKETNASYVRAASTAAAAFSVDELRALSGIPADTGTAPYIHVRQTLARILQANNDARFVYLMAQRDDKVVFLADAEPEDSPDASAPGDVYEEASPALLDALKQGQPFIEGPLVDRWGEWVTGFTPIRDRAGGTVVAVLGIDWEARQWRQALSVYRWFGLLFTVFPLLLAAAILAGFINAERINVLLTEEMHERRRAQNELERLSRQDPLTGLANRRTFDSLYDLEWRRALRAQLPLALLMVDVDEFKSYNDHHGHQAGDKALRRIAEAIRTAVKRAGDEPARYGGEEFAVILPAADLEGARHVADAVRREVELDAVRREDYPDNRPLTVSVGVASMVPGPNDAPANLISRADQALYRAKAAGRNAVACDEHIAE